MQPVFRRLAIPRGTRRSRPRAGGMNPAMEGLVRSPVQEGSPAQARRPFRRQQSVQDRQARVSARSTMPELALASIAELGLPLLASQASRSAPRLSLQYGQRFYGG